MLSLEEESYDSDFDLPSLPKVKNRTRDQITMNDRFLDENVPEDRNTNQYTKRADPAVEAYKWLMRWRIRVQTTDVSHITDAFSCWVPSCDGGIDITSGNYRRMAVDGSKELCHRFVYRFWYPSYSTDNDVSHLCGNNGCCRPSHLTSESRTTNKSRDGCVGFLFLGGRWIKVCKHKPLCVRVTQVSGDCISEKPPTFDK